MALLRSKKSLKITVGVVDAVSWYCAVALLCLIFVGFVRETYFDAEDRSALRTNLIPGRPCEEIYFVREGETLQTISEKCNDPYIVEENPHIQDPDDVYPGLVIKITPSRKSSELWRWR